MAVFLNMMPAMSAESEPPTAVSPYLHLRDATLGYHGPDVDLRDLPDIRIGWFGPSQATDSLAGDMWFAANLALEDAQAGAAGGAVPVRLIARWTADPWGSGVSQLARMVYEERPIALFGSIDSASTHLAEQVSAKANLPLVSPLATDPSVTLAGVPWMFSCAPTDDTVARALVADMLGTLRASLDRLAVVAATDHESRMTAKAVLREFSRRRHPVDFRFEISPGNRDLGLLRTALTEAAPAAVLIIAGAEDAARCVRLVREEEIGDPAGAAAGRTDPAREARPSQCKVFGAHTLGRRAFLDLAGDQAEGIRFPVLTTPDLSDARTAQFFARFTAARGRTPDDAALMAYDAMRLLLEGIRRGGPSRAAVRETLAKMGPWQGISGPIVFDGTGQNTRSEVGMATYRAGVLVRLPAGAPVPLQTANQLRNP